ncbi:MAG: AAA family ATPase [Kofleriaceae bacterium]|nr:AAA family ATPase [Kofleriaceae bacterium]
MRIYFVGSHATGKTTLCRYVSGKYKLPMISEVARSVLAEMETSFDAMRVDMEAVSSYQRKVFARQVTTEKQHSDKFVSDRAFDNLCYAADHTTIFSDMVKNAGFSEYMEWVSGGTVFFLRPHKSLLAEDGVRAGVEWDSVVRIDGMVKLLLEMYNVSYLPIESVSMQERVRAVQFVLDREIRSSEALKSSPLQNQHTKRMRESVEACAAKNSSNALATGGNGLIIARELAATMLPTTS